MIYAENIFICIVVPLLVSLFFIKDKVRHFVIFLFLGMTMCLLSAYISAFFGSLEGASAEDTSVFISPVIEEIMKFFPVAFLLLVFDPDDELITLSAIAIGIGFATFENCCYILTFGAESLPYILIRGLAVGVMHIVSITSLALWLIFVKRMKALSFPAVVGGLSLAMIFHALYNLLVSVKGITSIVGYLLPMLTAVCLYPVFRRLYKKENEH